jgi:hypothetical protein
MTSELREETPAPIRFFFDHDDGEGRAGPKRAQAGPATPAPTMSASVSKSGMRSLSDGKDQRSGGAHRRKRRVSDKENRARPSSWSPSNARAAEWGQPPHVRLTS